MNLFLKRFFLYIVAAWLLVGAGFMVTHTYMPNSQLEGYVVTARGFPMQFYAYEYSPRGAQPAQISAGFLAVDFVIWLMIVVIAHFLYNNLIVYYDPSRG